MEGDIKFISVSKDCTEDLLEFSRMINEKFISQLSEGLTPEIGDRDIKILNLGPMTGMSPEEAKFMTQQALEPIQDRDPHKYFRKDPTRYGDWEKDGLCKDF